MELLSSVGHIDVSSDAAEKRGTHSEGSPEHGTPSCCSPTSRGLPRREGQPPGRSGDLGPHSTASFGVSGMTCQACARKVQAALSAIPGVVEVSVRVAESRATVRFVPGQVSADQLKEAARAAGYGFLEGEAEEQGEPDRDTARIKSPFRNTWAYVVGSAAALGVVGFYLGLLTLTGSWSFARVQFGQYRWWILALAVGLGVQATLFTAVRGRLVGRNRRAATSSLAASSGVSTASMAACCTHYLVSVLPVLGLPFLSAALAGLAKYQTYFFAAGVVSNLFGIGLMARPLARNGMVSRVAALRR
jgi:Cu+-exporting ATPase